MTATLIKKAKSGNFQFTEEEKQEILRMLLEEEKRKKEEKRLDTLLAKARKDKKYGRYSVLKTDEDIHNFFEEVKQESSQELQK